jgi:hypothetical protein
MQEDLDQYRDTWNNHKIRTACHYTPNQLLNQTDGYEDPPERLDDEALYGVEQQYLNMGNEGDDDDGNHVYVSPVLCPLSANQEAHFINQVEPLTLNDRCDTLKDKFYRALDILIDTSCLNI